LLNQPTNSTGGFSFTYTLEAETPGGNRLFHAEDDGGLTGTAVSS
jgi:hypothetical protein